jgi:DNA-directed RNA polymerase subunit RPC12/RpoP
MNETPKPIDESKEYFCPDCWAEIPATAWRCWRCGSTFPRGADAISLDKEKVADTDRHTKFQFTLTSMMLLTVMTAVLSSIFVMLPGLGIALTILSVPALVRTAYVSMYRGPRGRPLTFQEKAVVFMAWIGLGLIAALAAGVASYITCLAAIFSGSPGEGVAVIIGTITALVTAAGLMIFFWRRYM